MHRAREEATGEDMAVRSPQLTLPAAVLGLWLLLIAAAPAQQITTATPFHSVGDSFFENMGTSWGLRGQSWNFSFGGSPVGAASPFGGFNPSAGANFGGGFGGRGINGFFGGNFSQGSQRSFVGRTPSVTTLNGMPGSFHDTSISPFVISHIPVVGGFPSVGFVTPFAPATAVQLPTYSMFGTQSTVSVPDRGNALLGGVNRAASGRNEFGAPGLPGNRAVGIDRSAAGTRVNVMIHDMAEMDERILKGSTGAPAGADSASHLDPAARRLAAARASSAGRPAPSVAEARRLRAAEQVNGDGEVAGYMERARNAEKSGKKNVAKIYYRMAARRASGELKEQILARLRSLEAPAIARQSPP